MFNENGYVEHIVKGKTPAGVILATVIGVIISLVGMGLVFATGGIGFSFLLIGIVVIVLAMSKRDVEYEYIMTNDDVDISRIVAKSSRKKVYSFTGKDVKIITKADSVYRDNEHQANPDIRSHVFVMDEAGDNVYAFILNVNGKPEEVLIETNDRVMEHIGSFFRGKLKK